jgi:hypothetical protein
MAACANSARPSSARQISRAQRPPPWETLSGTLSLYMARPHFQNSAGLRVGPLQLTSRLPEILFRFELLLWLLGGCQCGVLLRGRRLGRIRGLHRWLGASLRM